MKKKDPFTKRRDEVVATVRAIKYQTDRLKSYQDACAHEDINNGRCSICLKPVMDEVSLAQSKPERSVERKMSDVEFLLLCLFLFFKGYKKHPDYVVDKKSARWEKTVSKYNDNVPNRSVVQMKKDTGIFNFWLRPDGMEVFQPVTYYSFKEFIQSW